MNVKPLFSLEDKSERDGTEKMLTVSHFMLSEKMKKGEGRGRVTII